jgi:hypothetical protein
MRKLVLTAAQGGKYDVYPGEDLWLQARQRLRRRWSHPAQERIAYTWRTAAADNPPIAV